jgi:hypothetical protein
MIPLLQGRELTLRTNSWLSDTNVWLRHPVDCRLI